MGFMEKIMRINSMATQCYKAITNKFNKAKKCISVSGNCGSNQNVLTPTELEAGINITHVSINNINQPYSLVDDVTSRPSTAPELSAYLDSWVNEKHNERQFRQLFKNQIQIINNQLVVDGDLALNYANISSLPQHLHISGDFKLAHWKSLNELPQGLTVGGNIFVSDCPNLTTIHDGLTVGGNLDLSGCSSLATIHDGLTVGENLHLIRCLRLNKLPQRLHVGGNLIAAQGCNLTTLPEDLRVEGNLDLTSCIGLTSLPQGLYVGGDLNLRDCTRLTLRGRTGLTYLPQGLHVGGNLDLQCTSLTSLPQDLHVGGNLNLTSCIGLTSLPQGLTVGGNLDLSSCTGLTCLPQDLHVGGNLSLSYSSNLTELSQGLTVGGYLYLIGCTGITSISQDITVIGYIHLLDCNRITQLPDWVFNTNDLILLPDHLKHYNKTFKILKHFDKHNTIDGMNNQELTDLYNQDQDRINTLIHNRHCFRIAHALCSNQALSSKQNLFKNTASEKTKNQIRDQIIHMILAFKSSIYSHFFKQLPGFNNATPTGHSTNELTDFSERLPFIMNFGFLTTQETQSARRICRSLHNILDQKVAYENYTPEKPSLNKIEQILKNYQLQT